MCFVVLSLAGWEKYVYLRGRTPLLINSNYYGLGYAYHVPSHVQTARASILAHYFAHFKILLESERLAPTTTSPESVDGVRRIAIAGIEVHSTGS